jgi:hypothetical protein
MTTFTKTYNVNRMKQLIDLNGDSINYEINFRVYSQDRKPFDLVTVSQSELDNNPILQYQKVEAGEIEGQVVQNKNIFQSQYLVLKSDEPRVCVVEIQKKELPKTVEPPKLKNKDIVPNITNKSENSMLSNIPWTKIIIVLILIGAAVYFFFYYNNPEGENNDEMEINNELNFDNPVYKSSSKHSSRVSSISRVNSKANSLANSKQVSRQNSKPVSLKSSPDGGNDIINKLMSLKI